MLAHLRAHQLLTPGWSNSKGGRDRVERSLLAESWNDSYAVLGFDRESAEPPFLKPAVDELAKADAQVGRRLRDASVDVRSKAARKLRVRVGPGKGVANPVKNWAIKG